MASIQSLLLLFQTLKYSSVLSDSCSFKSSGYKWLYSLNSFAIFIESLRLIPTFKACPASFWNKPILNGIRTRTCCETLICSKTNSCMLIPQAKPKLETKPHSVLWRQSTFLAVVGSDSVKMNTIPTKMEADDIRVKNMFAQ